VPHATLDDFVPEQHHLVDRHFRRIRFEADANYASCRLLLFNKKQKPRVVNLYSQRTDRFLLRNGDIGAFGVRIELDDDLQVKQHPNRQANKQVNKQTTNKYDNNTTTTRRARKITTCVRVRGECDRTDRSAPSRARRASASPAPSPCACAIG
jgi:hypothetical protein